MPTKIMDADERLMKKQRKRGFLMRTKYEKNAIILLESRNMLLL